MGLSGRAGAQGFIPFEIATVVSGGIPETGPPFQDFARIQTVAFMGGRLHIRVCDTMSAQRVSDAVSYIDTV